jgi:hypothetical protein
LEREGDENAVRPVGCEAWGLKAQLKSQSQSLLWQSSRSQSSLAATDAG